jgi:hypothetical protein
MPAERTTTVVPGQLVLTRGTQWFEWDRQARRFANSLRCKTYLPTREDLKATYDTKKDPVQQLKEPVMPADGATSSVLPSIN